MGHTIARGWRWLVLLSLAWSCLVIAVEIGLKNTPNNATDSAGRTMGFNDPLSREHFAILLGHFRLGSLFMLERIYDWALLVMQSAGAWLLFSKPQGGHRTTRWFFAAQPLLFPVGWLGFVILPAYIFDFFFGNGFDREDVIDIPFVWCIAHPVWIMTSLLILIRGLPGTVTGVRAAMGRFFRRALAPWRAPAG